MHIIPIGLGGMGVICGYCLVGPVSLFLFSSVLRATVRRMDGFEAMGFFFHVFEPGRYVPRHYVRTRGDSVCMNSYGKHERGLGPSACVCVSVLAKATTLDCVREGDIRSAGFGREIMAR